MTDPHLKLDEPIGDTVKTTTCYMCACRCGIKVHIKKDRIRYIEGNKNHPVNRGVLCAKGSAGIAQHYSPARLHSPMLRVGKRGEGKFKAIAWEDAMQIAVSWLKPIRARNPNELAFFTGRDQSQALTGWWAQQFGTINYAAHGGFCSVNMAAAGLYTMGASFWEFGEPDWQHSKYFMLWGVAEDHDSNPIKLGLAKLKARGAKIVAINPIRTGYASIADEWIAIRPGSDGLLAMSLIHELIKADRIDLDFLIQHCNAHWLVIDVPGSSDDGMFARDGDGLVLCATRGSSAAESKPTIFLPATEGGIQPLVVGEFVLPDGRKVTPVFHRLVMRYFQPEYSPEQVAERTGIDASTIKRLAQELANAAFDYPVELNQAWTDLSGAHHASMRGRAVAMHAMRGISAHSNGFQTCRAVHVLQMLLGAIETPGSFRFQPPYPKGTPPSNKPGKSRKVNGALDAAPLGFVQSPNDLLVDINGAPQRIDHAFSWRYPLAAHGMMHTVIRNAVEANPHRIDTLMLYMANMSWNSAMNTRDTQAWLCAQDGNGEYIIPHIIYSDAYHSEMVNYADLILPDTTYLERYDCISLLDRPISDADAAIDAIRQPVLALDRDVRAFQSVLLDLGARLQLPDMVDENGLAKYPNGYPDYMVYHERTPGVGLLQGFRGERQDQVGIGAPSPAQLKNYAESDCFFAHEIPANARYFKMNNQAYFDWAAKMGLMTALPTEKIARQRSIENFVLKLYVEPLQSFRLAARGFGELQPPDAERARIERYFDPLPMWYEPFEMAEIDTEKFPLSAITQRPMHMYHSWGSQNQWLRQISARNVLYVHPQTAMSHELQEYDWVRVSSHHGEVIAQIELHVGVEPHTVWTWNAIGKQKGAWKLKDNAPESQRGFLLNPMISDVLPKSDYANADPITGQAAWFDLRVRLEKIPAPLLVSAPAQTEKPAKAGVLKGRSA